ncbi:TetR/AcrR family transcriptional regulator [Luedemannella flava]|uniref:TetR/AcrR family transcriptional regulator n=1 Tax=Luedemannella flava TaxID=349316 RepID=A0ABN2ME74_9ACTN
MTDAARSLALLWGTQTRTGRSGLSLRGIVTAAMSLADAQGLDAVSMRKLAEELGVGTMSLYTHVPGRTELLDLMIDSAYGELYQDVDEPLRQPGGWRGGLEFIARRNWDTYRRHPWLLSAAGVRPAFGPNAFLKYEAELRPIDGIGMSDVEMDSALTLVLNHVQGLARLAASLEQARRESSDGEWWQTQAPLLEKFSRGMDLPVAGRVGQASSEFYDGVADPQHALTFGLARILDGIERLIAD